MVDKREVEPRRGKVRRITPSSTTMSEDGHARTDPSRVRWPRRQDYHSHFTTLIGWELDDELASVEERLRSWSNKRLEEAGIALFKLHGRTAGWLFGGDQEATDKN